MKTILVLTDFTENASHAAKSAVMLGSKLNADLLLFNSYMMAPVIPHYAGGPWVVDEIIERENLSENKLRFLQSKLKTVVERLEADSSAPQIYTQSGEGSVGANVEDIIREKDVELVAMGARSGSTMEHILNGSETNDIINRSIRPVLIIPQDARLQKIKKVVFATDFNDEDFKALHYLSQLGKKLNFQLEVVHVSSIENKDTVNFEKKIFFNKLLKFDFPNMTYKEVRGKEVINRLNNLCNEEGADLLAMMHHQHSIFIRLFEHSITKEALESQRIPLLVIPSKLED
ncbi:MAG TPA: universal stress protein [Mucilaginibacter sp.]|jgi:nucleotide-binding universal stress UspA family protein|nr:universal stress protein [Mucilaginibacter sp.]